MDPHSRAPKNNTSYGNEVLPQDTTHLIQRPWLLPTRKSVPRSSRQSDLLTIVKRRKLQWYGHLSRSSGLAKTIVQDTVKGGRRQGRQRNRWEDNTWDGQAWSLPSPRGQWRTEENGGNLLWNHLWCPSDPRGERKMMMMMWGHRMLQVLGVPYVAYPRAHFHVEGMLRFMFST